MNIQITRDELKSYKDNIPCKCEHCNNIFGISKSDAYRNFKGTRITRFCSLKCKNENKIKSASVECVCLYCDKTFIKKKSAVGSNNFCSSNCAATYNNKQRTQKLPENCILCGQSLNKGSKSYCSRKCHRQFEYLKMIADWQTGLLSGVSGKILQVKNFIRKYMLELVDDKCSKCGWGVIHPTTLRCPLEINHIDGNPLNNDISNLEVLCPNCHSLTPNFRALNKNSPRNRK